MILSSAPKTSNKSPVCYIGIVSSSIPTMKKPGMNILGAPYFKGFNFEILKSAFYLMVLSIIFSAVDKTNPGTFEVFAAIS